LNVSPGAEIRNNIRRLRFEKAEMTQQALAERVGVTRQTVNAIELGKYSPSLEVAFRIAAVFAKPLEDVFQYRELPRARVDSGWVD
jgi:putative transcriptional regulator